MAKKEVEVKFTTITPLWTGDAWRGMNQIRPSSLIGSLRFWFEIICYFKGIVDNFNPKEVNLKKFREHIKKHGNTFEHKVQALLKQGIPLPAIIFGTTGWRSLIEIRRINFEKENFKIEPNGKILPNKNWYWGSPSYQGNFKVTFLVDENILNSILYPILTFMDAYGFWGGKWNIGYGRLKIENVRVKKNGKWIEINNWNKDKVILKDFNLNDIDIGELINRRNLNKNTKDAEFLKQFLSIDSFHCKNERKFREKAENIPKKVVLLNINNISDDYRNSIEEILRIKIKIRNCLRHICEEKSEQNNKAKDRKQKKSKFEECFDKDRNFQKDKEIECKSIKYKCKEVNRWRTFRHELLGERGKGSKICPFIYEENGKLKGGLISIAGLLNSVGRKNG